MSTKGYRLLDLKEGTVPVWKTEEEKLELLREGVRFVSLVMILYITNSLSHEIGQFDVTEVYDPEETIKPEAFARLASCESHQSNPCPSLTPPPSQSLHPRTHLPSTLFYRRSRHPTCNHI